jgi:ATP-dependent 26S proteasome regulatory subunit
LESKNNLTKKPIISIIGTPMPKYLVQLISIVSLFVLMLFSIANQINLLATFNQNKNALENEKNELETKKESMFRENSLTLKTEIERKVAANQILPAFIGQTIKITDLDDAVVEQQKKQAIDKQKLNPEMRTIVSR